MVGGSVVVACLIAAVQLRPALVAPPMPRGQISAPLTPLPRFLQGGIDLLGYDLPVTAAPPLGVPFRAVVYWQPARPLLENNQSEAWLTNLRTGERVATVRHRHPGGVPTLHWVLGRYVRDEFVFPAMIAPGDYLLQVAVGPCAARGVRPCERVDGMDAYTVQGQAEREAVTIPTTIRVGP
jgi:hypothetical protein